MTKITEYGEGPCPEVRQAAMTLQDYIDALNKLPDDWKKEIYTATCCMTLWKDIIVMARRNEITAYDRSDGTWKNPSLCKGIGS